MKYFFFVRPKVRAWLDRPCVMLFSAQSRTLLANCLLKAGYLFGGKVTLLVPVVNAISNRAGYCLFGFWIRPPVEMWIIMRNVNNNESICTTLSFVKKYCNETWIIMKAKDIIIVTKNLNTAKFKNSNK